ncbi:cytochrome P450 [Nocardia tengchongensis]|uniref:cytochrome P450 n=1 Tax=Nocardia tengchongensis TaxID=2055889 RepID=UPI00365D5703
MVTLAGTPARQLPPLVSGSRGWGLGHLLELHASSHSLLQRGVDEHGHVFRIAMPAGKTAVVLLGEHVRPARDRHTFFGNSFSTQAAYPFFTKMFAPDFFSLGSPEEYVKQKGLIQPTLVTHDQVGAYLDIMNDEVIRFVDNLGDEGEFELTDEMGGLVLRIAARCFLGETFAAEMPQNFFALMRDFSELISPLPKWLPTLKGVKGMSAGKQMKRTIAAIIESRRANPLAEPDFVQILATQPYPDGSPVPIHVLVNLVLLLLWAGHETTTGHSAFAILSILLRKEVLAKARAEVDEVFSGRDTLDQAAVARLSYLDACIHETERVHPIAPLIARNTTSDIEIGDFLIPADTIVFTSPGIQHKLPSVFPDRPDEFDPERFLNQHTRAGRRELIGFGAGRHHCLGMHFAKLETSIVLAHLHRRLDMQVSTGEPRPIQRTTSQWPESPCRIAYRKRDLPALP